MMLTVKFVKSILPKKVHKYICKDYCGDKMIELLIFALNKIANNDIDIPADVYAQRILEEIESE